MKREFLRWQCAADFIDHLILQLESGLSVERSFEQALEQARGDTLFLPAQEVLSLARLGYSFSQSVRCVLNYPQLSKDIYGPLRDILEKIELSLSLGTPLLAMLEHLSTHFRLLANLRLEEWTQEVPIKMIFPLVFFIFPVIFILVGAQPVANFFHSIL